MKKLFTLCLAVMASVGLMRAEIYSGTCGAEGDGSHLQWSLNSEDSTLTITGSGPMFDYESRLRSPDDILAPWRQPYLKKVVMQSGITHIGKNAFYLCENLTSVDIPNSVESIGVNAFTLSGLTSVEIPNSVTSIKDAAFSTCRSLSSVVLPENITEITYEVFINCNALTELTIPDGVTSIKNLAFSGCTGLVSLVIPNSVTEIDNSAFTKVPNIIYSGTAPASPYPSTIWGARNRNGIVDGLMVFSSDKTMLRACSSVMEGNVIVPEGVTHIMEETFYKCDKITSIKIPNSVQYIRKNAFTGCSGLKRLFVYASTPPAGYSGDTEMGLSADVEVYVPKGSAEAYKQDKRWKDLNIIELDALSVNITTASTSASIEFTQNFWSLDNNYIASVAIEGGATYAGNTLEYNGLEPNSTYSDIPVILTSNTGEKETVHVSFSTKALELTTEQSKPVSSTTAILLAQTNMADNEISCGFEYKRDNAPADMAGTKVFCPVANGTMAGRIKNLRDDVYYKYRAFYQSTAGNTQYGDWQYIFTGDVAIEFEPVLYTYAAAAVTENSASLKGYALAGSDDFTEQGFEYWSESRAQQSAALRRMPAALGEHKTVQAEGISFNVTLTDLDAGTVYKYRTYAKIGGQIRYGSEMSFTTMGTYTPPTYTISFVNWDGTALQSAPVEEGTMPVYSGETPVRPNDAEYTYTFVGWTPELAAATEDATYTATFDATPISEGIEDVSSDAIAPQKRIVNGQILILRGEKTYTVTGSEVK